MLEGNCVSDTRDGYHAATHYVAAQGRDEGRVGAGKVYRGIVPSGKHGGVLLPFFAERQAHFPKSGDDRAHHGKATWTLGRMLEVAVEKRVMVGNPFATTGGLRDRVLLNVCASKKKLPRRGLGCGPPEFLALTRARKEEGNSARAEDDNGETRFLRGTKSESSERSIPVHDRMRKLLDRLKAESTDGRLLTVRHSGGPMSRACQRLGSPRLTYHALRHYYPRSASKAAWRYPDGLTLARARR